jgi:hypothetical protein
MLAIFYCLAYTTTYLLQIIDNLLLVTGELRDLWTIENGAGADTLGLDGGQASGKDGLTDQGDWHTEIESVDGGPLSGSLLPSRVENLFDEWLSIGGVIVLEDIFGDLNEERVQNTSVPLLKNLADLIRGESNTTSQDIVGFANQLHVTVLNTVVNHLDEVTSTLISDPLAASFSVALGRDILEDILKVGPGLLVSSWHDRRSVSGTLLTTRNTGTNKSDALLGELLGSAVGVWEVRVSTIDNDIALLQEWEESGNEVVDGLTGLDEKHNSSWSLQLLAKLLNRMGTDDRLAYVMMSASDI